MCPYRVTVVALKRWGVLLVAVICVAVVAAYFALQPTGPTQPELGKLRIGCQPSWHHIAFYVMLDKGWIQKVLGLEPEVHPFESGPSEMDAMLAGQLDIAYVGAAPPLPRIAKGLKAKIVAVANTEGSSLVVKGFDYTGPQSLKGKKISCYPPGSVQYTVLVKWLKENGLEPGKDVEIVVHQGPGDQHAALVSGAVDAAIFPDPHPSKAVLEEGAKIAVNTSQMWPHHPCCLVVATEDLITKHRDLVVKFIALHIVASQYVIDPSNREEVVRIIMKYVPGISRKVAETFPFTTNISPDPANRLWLEGLDKMCEALYELGMTKDAQGNVVRLRASEIVDATLYEEALKLIPQIKAELGLS
jgi:NitT/TauT family transport system substrate-binding protein